MRREDITEEELTQEGNALFSERTRRRVVQAMIQEREIKSDIELSRNQTRMRERGLDPTGMILNEGFQNALANVQAGFNTFVSALGQNQSVVVFLNELAETLRSLGEWISANSNLMDPLIEYLRGSMNEAIKIGEALESSCHISAPPRETIESWANIVNQSPNQLREHHQGVGQHRPSEL